MALVKEVFEDNDVKIAKHYSDANKYIRKVGDDTLVEEAWTLDIQNVEYEETDTEIGSLNKEAEPIDVEAETVNTESSE